MEEPSKKITNTDDLEFTGNIYIFHAFDIGDDINLEKIETSKALHSLPLKLPKYFKRYHEPLSIELPHPHATSHTNSCRIHSFGAVSLTYKIPFKDTLANIRENFNDITNSYQEQSIADTRTIYNKIEKYIVQPQFFQTRSSYIVLQVDPQPDAISLTDLQKQYGSIIASTLRFETEVLSEYQKNEIMDSAIGYFRGDLIIIDVDAAFAYNSEFEEIIDLFEFANIQHLELGFFDRLLDERMNVIYERKVRKLPFTAYLPFLGTLISDPIGQLGKLKADISVIIERLESTVKLAGEPYFLEIYELLVDNLDLKNWRDSIDRKLQIVEDVQTVYQRKIDTNREDMLTVLIIVLIFIELIIGVLHYLK
jgi:hypothetical protein